MIIKAVGVSSITDWAEQSQTSYERKSDDGYVSLYWYDADGNRTVKEHLGGEAVWVNGTHAGLATDTLTYSVYPNAYVSINGNRWTKHYYIGSERIASRTGILSDGFNSLSTSDNNSAGFNQGINVDYDNMCLAEEDSIAAMYERFGVPYDVQHANSRGKAGHLLIPITRGNGIMAGTSAEAQTRNHPHPLDGGQVYYFHRDHLGGTLSVTDSLGAYVQQEEYTPWGEVFVEKQSGSSGFTSPYLFNGKELDEETGLYYYGARYYDPKTSVWYSTDPLQEIYPFLTSYNYVNNNPIRLIDPNGNTPVGAIVEGIGAFFVSAGIDFFTKWIFDGQNFSTAYRNINWKTAVFDGFSTAALSFFIDGTGSAKTFKKIASSKPGRIAISVAQTMTTNIIGEIESGTKISEINWEKHLFYATISTLISMGMNDKANELLNGLHESNAKMYNAIRKMQRNLSAGKSEARINSDKNKVKIATSDANKKAWKYGMETTKNKVLSGSLTGTSTELCQR